MTFSRIIVALSFLVMQHTHTAAQDYVPVNDSMTLAQAFINLSLTRQYFDILPLRRISKIIPYEKNELGTIVDTLFITSNPNLFNLTQSLFYLNQTKLLIKNKGGLSRNELINWKMHLDKCIDHFNKADIYRYLQHSLYPPADDIRSYNEFIGFSDTLCDNVKNDIRNTRNIATPFFNENIYPDFQRIFYQVKKTEQFNFDSLTNYTMLFGLPLSRYILDNEDLPRRKTNLENKQGIYTLNQYYATSQKLELISKYLQLFFLAGTKNTLKLSMGERFKLHKNFYSFDDELTQFYKNNLADSFFIKEINAVTSKNLYEKIKLKYPLSGDGMGNPMHMAMPSMIGNDGAPLKYYFPIPAPHPSTSLYLNNFKPALTTCKQVDDYLVNILNGGGYNGRMHYYYVKSGFAITTSLEKISKDGSPASSAQRWNVSESGNGSFSLYQTFKSIFFETESNFRIFALIVSPGKAAVQSSASSLAAMNELIKYSYPSLPADLENVVPPSKTLSVLVYQYKQSDVGEVPVLEIKNPITIQKHLNNSGLGALLQP